MAHEKFYDSLSEKQIRKRQQLCEAQIAIAHARRQDDALARLRKTYNELTEALLRRT